MGYGFFGVIGVGVVDVFGVASPVTTGAVGVSGTMKSYGYTILRGR